MDSLLQQYIDETEELAMKGLRENRHILDIITQELVERSRITGLVRYGPFSLMTITKLFPLTTRVPQFFSAYHYLL